MKFLFNILLGVFTAVSAYVTYTLTSSLANNLVQHVAFAALGGAFDVLKCLLPAAIIAGGVRQWGKVSQLVLILIGLITWSFYASIELFDASNERKLVERIESTTAYTTLQKQLDNYQTSYDKLVAMEYISKADAQYSDKIEDTGAKMTAMIEAAKSDNVQSMKDTILNLVAAFLLEVSTIGCHLAKAVYACKTHAKQTQKEDEKEVHEDTHASARDEHAQGLSEDSACTSTGARAEAKSARETVYKMTAKELATLLKTNNDESLSYRKITDKYGVKNSDTIKAAKQILINEAQELEDAKAEDNKSTLKNDIPESNIILLPTMTK